VKSEPGLANLTREQKIWGTLLPCRRRQHNSPKNWYPPTCPILLCSWLLRMDIS